MPALAEREGYTMVKEEVWAVGWRMDEPSCRQAVERQCVATGSNALLAVSGEQTFPYAERQVLLDRRPRR